MVTLTLSQHSWVMGSAHHLTEANIWPRSKENLFRGKGDMELKAQGSNSWPLTVTLTLSSQGWVMGSAHCPTKVNIRPKFRENHPRGKGDTEWTQNSRHKPVTLNCDLVSLHGWAMGSAHRFTEANIWPKLKENPSRGKGEMSGHKIQGSNSWPWTVTLSLSSHGWVMGSAYRPTGEHLTKVYRKSSQG